VRILRSICDRSCITCNINLLSGYVCIYMYYVLILIVNCLVFIIYFFYIFYLLVFFLLFFFFFQAEDGIRDSSVTGVQTCALPIWSAPGHRNRSPCARRAG